MDELTARRQLISYAQQLGPSRLSQGKSGNLSVRYGANCLITPSGVDYTSLKPEDIVSIDFNGNKNCSSPYAPSSEWHFHAAVYINRPDIHAVVHSHAPYSTALACCHRSIPAFHYMVAIAGGNHIPLVPYDLFGTEQLACNVKNALTQVNACLMANHGMIAVESSLAKAFSLAIEVEELAKQYQLALSIGEPKLLSETQMQEALKRFKSYGSRLS